MNLCDFNSDESDIITDSSTAKLGRIFTQKFQIHTRKNLTNNLTNFFNQ